MLQWNYCNWSHIHWAGYIISSRGVFWRNCREIQKTIVYDFVIKQLSKERKIYYELIFLIWKMHTIKNIMELLFHISFTPLRIKNLSLMPNLALSDLIPTLPNCCHPAKMGDKPWKEIVMLAATIPPP